MNSLPYLIAEMRALGMKRLEIELEPAPPVSVETQEAEQPEPKPEGACAWDGCAADREGILGGIATQYCRKHAFQMAGVKS